MIKLVVVDDHPLVGETINYILTKNRPEIKYVGQALSGSQGLELARQYNPDIALVDLKMPGMNGFIFTQELKNILPKTKVSIITALDDPEYIQRALQIGVTDYLLKPLSCQQILDLIDKLCGEFNLTVNAEPKTYSIVIASKLNELIAYIKDGKPQDSAILTNEIWQELVNVSNNGPSLIRIRAIEIASEIFISLEENNCTSDAVELLFQSFMNKIAKHSSTGFTEIYLKEFVESLSNIYNKHIHETWYKQISRAKELIELNLHADITLEGISSNVYLSPYYLSHLFKEKTGTSFMDYVIERRLEKAKLLLAATNEKIETVAIKTGYENANSFRRLFKKRTGISPSEYRFNATKMH